MYMFRAIFCSYSGGPPEDEQDIARNMYMYRIVINVFKKFVH